MIAIGEKVKIAGKLCLRIVTAGCTAAGLLLLLVTFTPFVSWYALRLAGPWYTPEGDVLVVLGAAGPNLGVMDLSTYWRCTYAVTVYRQHPFNHVIVSGRDVAPGMRDLMVFSGIPADRILVENLSESTYENAVEATRLLTNLPGRKVLLTSDSHMFRAYRAFVKQGVEITPAPIPDAIKQATSYRARWGQFTAEVGETVKIAYYYYKGWI